MKWIKKKRIWIPLILIAGIALGPRMKFATINPIPQPLELTINELDDFLEKRESKVANLKPNNQSRIVWNDSLHQKTPYSVVYLHGFSASPMEADPIHLEFAKRYGCNIYLPRLTGHGIDDIESFKNLEPQELVESAQEALAIGALIGEQVIVMSCSTGSTLSIYLAATQPEKVSSMIMYSPNINLYDSKTKLLTAPWGLQLAKWMRGSCLLYTSDAADE